MKKFLSLLMALTMLMACTACFGSAESASDPAAYDGSEVNITFYNTMGSNLTPVLDTYIEEFNKLYPNIHVSYTSVGGYDDVRDQISKEITVGGQPNIAYCYPDHVALYNLARAVQPLDAYIDSTATITRADGTTETFGLTQEQKDDFISAYYEEGRQFDVHAADEQVHRSAVLQQDVLRRERPDPAHHLGRDGSAVQQDRRNRPVQHPAGL